jgi:hypothetical protein
VGDTDTLPEVATLPIELSMLTVVAFVEVQVSVALWPAVIVDALDARVTVGPGLGGGVVDAPPPPQPASSDEISIRRTMCNDALQRRASFIISADHFLTRKCIIASTCCCRHVGPHNSQKVPIRVKLKSYRAVTFEPARTLLDVLTMHSP